LAVDSMSSYIRLVILQWLYVIVSRNSNAGIPATITATMAPTTDSHDHMVLVIEHPVGRPRIERVELLQVHGAPALRKIITLYLGRRPPGPCRMRNPRRYAEPYHEQWRKLTTDLHSYRIGLNGRPPTGVGILYQ